MGGAVGENAWENRAGFFALELELDFFKKTLLQGTVRNKAPYGQRWREKIKRNTSETFRPFSTYRSLLLTGLIKDSIFLFGN